MANQNTNVFEGFSSSFTNEMTKSIRNAAMQSVIEYFGSLAEHIHSKTGYDREKVQEAINSFTGGFLSSLRSDVIVPIGTVPLPITDVWVGFCFEMFGNGQTRESFIVGGINGRSHPAYNVVSKLIQKVRDDSTVRGKWGWKPQLNKVEKVWMFPKNWADRVRKELKDGNMNFTETNKYHKNTENEKAGDEPEIRGPSVGGAVGKALESKRKISETALKNLPSRTVSATKDQFWKWVHLQRKGNVTMADDEIVSRSTDIPVGVCRYILDHYDDLETIHSLPSKTPAVPKKTAVIEKSIKKFTRRTDNLVWNRDHSLVFECDKKKKYPAMLYCVGASETLNGSLMMLSQDDVDILNDHKIKYDPENVYNNDHDEQDDEPESENDKTDNEEVEENGEEAEAMSEEEVNEDY